MSIHEIDYDEAKRIVKMAVDSKPECFVYQKPEGRRRCQYQHVNAEGLEEPGCLIGTALYLGGYVSLEQLGEMDQQVGSGIHTLAQEYLADLPDPVILSREARLAMEEAQGEQDHGETWQLSYLHAFGE